jgi:biotin--protein ligase
VVNVSSSTLKNEPWQTTTALLAIPGGADLPYCKELNGKGTDIIKDHVRRGGRYIGFCAGGYFGSNRVEFEVGDPVLEVSGSRELGFFPGTCRGSAFSGFEYGTHAGGRAVKVSVNGTALQNSSESTERRPTPSHITSYINGGGVFVDAAKYRAKGVEILASYAEPIAVDGGDGDAAVVHCMYGRGSAILTGIHPEFSFDSAKRYLNTEKDKLDVSMVATLNEGNQERTDFLRLCLQKLGLKVNFEDNPVPKLSRLALTAISPSLLDNLLEKLTVEVGYEGPNHNLLKGSNDTFRLTDSRQTLFAEDTNVEEYDDPNDAVKEVEVYLSGYPNHRQTPHFNHETYYYKLQSIHRLSNHIARNLGNILLYGEVVTSTSTMLDKNYNILRCLPHGLISVGTIQVSGRGRGNNVWVNPPGVLAVSGVLRIAMQAAQSSSPIVFVQYLVSLAMVEAIRGYGPGYEEMPIHLKWPNDIYARNPSSSGIDVGQSGVLADEYLKIGGIIVNSNILDGEYILVFGAGTNVSNAAPTTSINLILDALNVSRVREGRTKLPAYKSEILLAIFVSQLEEMLESFKYQGFGAFEQLYYKRWLHTDKIVTLEQYNNTKAIIRGITSDFGMLVVEEVDREDRPLGRRIELQPDGNSFDMFKGLLKKKV